MTQMLQSPYAVPVLQIVAGFAVLQIFTGKKSPFAEFAATKLSELTGELLDASKKMLYDFPVIAISAGLTYIVQEFATHRLPFLSLSMQGTSPLKVAACIAGILALRSASSIYLERVIDSREEDKEDKNVRTTRQAVIRNVVPIAAGCVAAYYAGVPVKLAQTALFTLALIPVVKLLGKGFESFINIGIVNDTFETVIGWTK
jgi:hypothetical protein